jgi:hypothetical protein
VNVQLVEAQLTDSGSSSGIESDKSANKNKVSLLKKEYSEVTAEKMI